MRLSRSLAMPLLALAACAAPPTALGQATVFGPTTLGQARADPLAEAAALLAAAEGAGSAAERAPLIAQLDALGVHALPESEGDLLGAWRSEHRAEPALVYRGRTLGPGYRRAQLAAGQELVIDQIFYAGERAEMAAQTQGGQPVVLAVANPRTEKVCEARLDPQARCRWLPIFTERFSITLSNRGTTPASVYLVFE
jgi:hypothetical protein